MAPKTSGVERSARAGENVGQLATSGIGQRNHQNAPVIVTLSGDNSYDHLLPDSSYYSHFLQHRDFSSSRYWRSKRATCLFCTVIIVLVALFCITVVAAANLVLQKGQPSISENTVQTDCGPVKGHFSEGVHSFLGIPYALPPVGDLRWKSPVSTQKHCSKAKVSAHKPFPPCLQQVKNDPSGFIGSEDCLKVSVWSPNIDRTASTPVLVVMHGDGQMFGERSAEMTMVSLLVQEAQVVLVSVAYRLGVFGFLTANLSSEIIRGNFAVMDQLMALEWVQNNIERFGGNPQKVTLFGKDSGSATLLELLKSPKTKGLFQRVWAVNVAPASVMSLRKASDANKAFITHSHCKDIQCLRNLSPAEILTAYTLSRSEHHHHHHHVRHAPWRSFPLVADGIFLHELTSEAWRTNPSFHVPLLIGSTPQLQCNLKLHLHQNNSALLQQHFGMKPNESEEALELYGVRNYTHLQILNQILFDIDVCIGWIIASNAAKDSSSSVYHYFMDADIPKSLRTQCSVQSTHSEFWKSLIPGILSDPTNVKSVLSQQLWKGVLSFIKNGQPGISLWKAVPGSVLLTNNGLKSVSGYHSRECAFWQRTSLLPVS